MSLPTSPRGWPALCAAISALLVTTSHSARAQGAAVALPEVVVQGASTTGASGLGTQAATPTPATLAAAPAGQVQTAIGPDRTVDTLAFDVGNLLLNSPGVTVKLGNGPRDFGISIRGSGARTGFGIRNIKIYDDGFPITQADGLARSDALDPHAYGSVNVIRGPSSALYGNYATGGVVQFETFAPAAIDGLVLGADGGSYGYSNDYLLYGRKSGKAETFVFGSNVVGDSATSHSNFNTQTANALLRYQVTPEDRLTFKLIENHLRTQLSNRLSLSQFFINPYQRGCANAAASAPGCQNLALFANGSNGRTVATSADQAGLGRNDNRIIFGARWEHDFGTAATWRTQVTADDRNYNQPTGTTSAIGDVPSLDVISDVVARGTLFGLPSLSYAGLYLNTVNTVGYSFNLAPGGNGTLGGLSSVTPSNQTNVGGRAREELKLTDKLLLVAGIAVEGSAVNGQQTSYTYAAPNVTSRQAFVAAKRRFLNTAPELSLTYRPVAPLAIIGRVATGYGTPNAGNLFVNAAGVAGNNIDLKSQTNVGGDLAVTYNPLPALTLSVDGFYEFFRNELVSQSPGPGLLTYTFNAPKSEHRGIEVGASWAFARGFLFTTAYTYDNQIYTDFNERLSAGAFTANLDRRGNRIPGVAPNELLLRLGYDVPTGPLRGLGAYAEYILEDDFFVDNANLVKAPGYGLVNLNVHYSRPVAFGPLRDVNAYVEVRNVAGTTYVASANNLTDSLNATTGRPTGAATLSALAGSIYAGTPRALFGGVRLRF